MSSYSLFQEPAVEARSRAAHSPDSLTLKAMAALWRHLACRMRVIRNPKFRYRGIRNRFAAFSISGTQGRIPGSPASPLLQPINGAKTVPPGVIPLELEQAWRRHPRHRALYVPYREIRNRNAQFVFLGTFRIISFIIN